MDHLYLCSQHCTPILDNTRAVFTFTIDIYTKTTCKVRIDSQETLFHLQCNSTNLYYLLVFFKGNGILTIGRGANIAQPCPHELFRAGYALRIDHTGGITIAPSRVRFRRIVDVSSLKASTKQIFRRVKTVCT